MSNWIDKYGPPHPPGLLGSMWAAASRVFEGIPGRYFIAGGALRAVASGEETKDIDLFFPDFDAKQETATALWERGYKSEKPRGDSWKFSRPGKPTAIDLVFRRDRTTPEAAFDEFDFTVCRAAAERSGRIWIDVRFQQDVKDKILYPRAFPQPGSNIVHMLKLSARGYILSLDHAKIIVQMIRELPESAANEERDS